MVIIVTDLDRWWVYCASISLNPPEPDFTALSYPKLALHYLPDPPTLFAYHLLVRDTLYGHLPLGTSRLLIDSPLTFANAHHRALLYLFDSDR